MSPNAAVTGSTSTSSSNSKRPVRSTIRSSRIIRTDGVVMVRYKSSNERNRNKEINNLLIQDTRNVTKRSSKTSKHALESIDLLDECEVNFALLEARGLLNVPYNNKTKKPDWTASIGMQWTRFLKLSIEMVPMRCDKWVPDYQRMNCSACDEFLNPLIRGLRHHCRVCGDIYCGSCSNTKELVYEKSNGLKKPINGGKNCRICNGCFEKCDKARSVVQYCISPGMMFSKNGI
jgi:hypothetical protein